MSEFLKHCNQLSRLDEEATHDLLRSVTGKSVRKGDYLLKAGEVCRHLFFVEEGLLKTFFTGEDKEFIMRFFPENWLFTVLDSFVSQSPSTYMIIALEPTNLTCISHEKLEELCKKHHCIERFYRKLVSFASINMMKRISEMLEENATERYKHFVENNRELTQRISLGDLSSYLGITQVSLSRIRAK